MIMKKELKRRIITVIVGAVIMCMVSLVPEMVQAYASTGLFSFQQKSTYDLSPYHTGNLNLILFRIQAHMIHYLHRF